MKYIFRGREYDIPENKDPLAFVSDYGGFMEIYNVEVPHDFMMKGLRSLIERKATLNDIDVYDLKGNLLLSIFDIRKEG